MVSKKLQSKSVCMDTALEQIEGAVSYFKKYRDEGFNRSIDIAEEMDVEPIFPKTHKGKRKKHFDE
jgi:hypothetical protein